MVDEGAVAREFANERIDLRKVSGRGGRRSTYFRMKRYDSTPISTAARAASSTTAGPCFLASARMPRISPDAVRAVLGLDMAADDADLRAGRVRAPQEREGRQRRARRPVVVVDAVISAGGPR